MNLFKTNRKIFTLLCICPMLQDANLKMIIKNISFVAVLLIVSLISVCASSAYIMKHGSVEIEGTLYAVFQLAALFVGLNNMIGGIVHRHKMQNLLDGFQNTFEMCKLQCSSKFYSKFQCMYVHRSITSAFRSSKGTRRFCCEIYLNTLQSIIVLIFISIVHN